MTLDALVMAGGTTAAVLVAAWPKLKPVLGLMAWPVKPDSKKATPVSFQGAIAALAAVRGRLVATGASDAEGVGRAIEVLTLALVEGSDK